jgi:hypothetical protein
MAAQAGFFGSEDRLRALSAAGDPLGRLKAVVDLSCFALSWRLLCSVATVVRVVVRRMMRF